MTTTKAKALLETIKQVFNETTVTTTDIPNFDKVKSTLLVQNSRVDMPQAPHISTVGMDGHQYTVMDSSHPQAPNGMKDSITSSPEGIEHIKTMTSNVGPA